jgi:hypothetical protein
MRPRCFTGDLERVLRRTATEMGETKFSEHLKQLNADVTGTLSRVSK